MIYTHNEILFSLRKEGNPVICDNMDEPEGLTLSEKSQTERQVLDGITYLWNLKKKKKVRLVQSIKVVLRGSGWRTQGEFVKECKLLLEDK